MVDRSRCAGQAGSRQKLRFIRPPPSGATKKSQPTYKYFSDITLQYKVLLHIFRASELPDYGMANESADREYYASRLLVSTLPSRLEKNILLFASHIDGCSYSFSFYFSLCSLSCLESGLLLTVTTFSMLDISFLPDFFITLKLPLVSRTMASTSSIFPIPLERII